MYMQNKLKKSLTAENVSHLSDLPNWSDLECNFQQIQSGSPAKLFSDKKARADEFSISCKNIRLDYSLQAINKQTITNLTSLAISFDLQKHIEKLFSGAHVNINQNRPALHTALRANNSESIFVNGEDIIPEVIATRKQMLDIATQIRQHKWFKNSNKKVTDIVNIGMGGSDLGPKMAVHALQEFNNTDINFHFISNDDPKQVNKTLRNVNLNSTIFIVTSKSFTTYETISTLKKVINLFAKDSDAIAQQIIAITNQKQLARKYKIKNILPIWDWVGGRYSFCSAVNLSLAIMIGEQEFLNLLAGAKEMDLHFKKTPYIKNMPVILALLDIWNINFFHSRSNLILSYSEQLSYLPEYIQQLTMESNGKSINNNQQLINYSTSPIVWGGLGAQAEHTYYQLLQQGTHYHHIDYFFVGESNYIELNKLAFKKLAALTSGVGSANPEQFKIASSQLYIDKITPTTLGELIALYEHRIYCQSVLWNINAFDQPGVDAAKELGWEY